MPTTTTPPEIDTFTYALNRPPCHLEPYVTNESTVSSSETVPAFIATSATRDFFRMIEKYRNEKKLHLINQNKVLPTGQVVGEFCVCYIQTLHFRRQSKASSATPPPSPSPSPSSQKRTYTFDEPLPPQQKRRRKG